MLKQRHRKSLDRFPVQGEDILCLLLASPLHRQLVFVGETHLKRPEGDRVNVNSINSAPTFVVPAASLAQHLECDGSGVHDRRTLRVLAPISPLRQALQILMKGIKSAISLVSSVLIGNNGYIADAA